MKMNKVEKLTILLIYTDYVIYIFMRQHLSLYNVRYCTIIFFLSLCPAIRILQFKRCIANHQIQYNVGTFKILNIFRFLKMALCFETKIVCVKLSTANPVCERGKCKYYALCHPFKLSL
jgi:hypothetical protein